MDDVDGVSHANSTRIITKVSENIDRRMQIKKNFYLLRISILKSWPNMNNTFTNSIRQFAINCSNKRNFTWIFIMLLNKIPEDY